MKLRPYQRIALEAVFDRLIDKGEPSTIVVKPTGTGKTVFFSHVADQWETGRVLILAHRRELIKQAADKAERVLGERPPIEMGDSRADDGMFGEGKVVVASIQTLAQQRRLDRFRPEDFGLVVVDECHHCVPSNVMYWRVYRHFAQNPYCKFLGVTATPTRADEASLSRCFSSVAFEYDILDAISDGWLVPVEQQFVQVKELDFSEIRTTAGDLNGADLERVMMEEKVLHRVVSPTVEIAGEEPTLIFAASVAHAQTIADILRRHNKTAVALHGGTPEDVRDEELRRYARGEYQYLVGCDLFYEGFDEPRISVVVMAKPTKSLARYIQGIGRGTRVLPGVLDNLDDCFPQVRRDAIASSPKPKLLVLDFVGNSGRHKLCSTFDALAGKAPSEAVLRALDLAKKAGRPVDPREAIDAAEEGLERERSVKEERRRREEEARRRVEEERQRIRATADYWTEDVDPFEEGAGFAGRDAGYAREKPATANQRTLLEKHKRWRDGMTFQEASRTIARMRKEWAGEICTEKQAAALRRCGEVANVSKWKASALLDLLKARGWEPRDYRLTRDKWAIKVLPDGYAPIIRDPDVGSVILQRRFRTEADCREYISACLELSEMEAAA